MLRTDWRRDLVYTVALVAACLVSRVVRDDVATISVVWPAIGVALMWLRPPARPTAVVARALVVLAVSATPALLSGTHVALALMFAGTTLAGVLAGVASFGRAWAGRAVRLTTVADGVRLAVVALVTGAVSAGGVALVAVTWLDGVLLDQAGVVLVRNALGAFLVGAVVLGARSWSRPVHLDRWVSALAAESALTVLVYAAGLVLAREISAPFVALPVSLWIALRSDVLRASLHAALVAGLTVLLVLEREGLFHEHDFIWRFVVGQSFIAVVALTTLGLALVRAEQLAATARAESTAERLRHAIDRSITAQLTVALDATDGLVVSRANPAADQLLADRPGRLVGTTWTDHLDPAYRPVLERVVGELRTGARTEWQGELVHVRPDGALRSTLASVATMDHQDVDGRPSLTVQLHDITVRKEVEHRLAHRALHDALTGLANRDLLQRRVEHALAEPSAPGTHAALLFFDLDHFKHVNDSLGHAAGDEVITTVAARLREHARDGDTVARIGGDEFVVCCPGVTETEAMAIADRLLAAVSKPIRLGAHDVTMTSSIGVTVASPGATTEQLLRHADTAMYAAKDGGRAQVKRFHDDLAARAARHLELDEGLRTAVREGQFVVHYQPVVDIGSGATVGLEALVRWQHPARGLLLPAEWIDVAEETDLMVPIGGWVLREACREVAALPCDLSVYVNVSARQLRQSGLVEETLRALEAADLPARRLVLELTESHLIEVHHSLLTDLHALRALGVRIAVDDFGTGFSSLRQLVDLPVDALKIDRAFVAAMDEDPRAATVVHAIIGMASTLGLGLVAEGVETPEQAATLAAAGCATGQGFLWSRPQPADRVLGVLAPGPASSDAGAPEAALPTPAVPTPAVPAHDARRSHRPPGRDHAAPSHGGRAPAGTLES